MINMHHNKHSVRSENPCLGGQRECRSPQGDRAIPRLENVLCALSCGEWMRGFHSLLRVNLPSQLMLGCSLISFASLTSCSVCLSFLARILMLLSRMQ